jgi:membrane-bound ClpP family serine protease
MSAGTVFAMSGDKIFMNHFSALGPIDPQVPKEGKWIPALSYLAEYEALIEKSRLGQLTTAEFALLNKFDLGELHTFKQARDLSVELLEKWLSAYKFKDWTTTETRQTAVTTDMRRERAREVAKQLVDHQRWHSHARCISMKTLRDDLKIKIEDYDGDVDLRQKIHRYFDVFRDYLAQKGIPSFVHSCHYL